MFSDKHSHNSGSLPALFITYFYGGVISVKKHEKRAGLFMFHGVRVVVFLLESIEGINLILRDFQGVAFFKPDDKFPGLVFVTLTVLAG